MINPMLHRLLNVYAQRFITEKLLGSPIFHRLARVTHEKVTEITQKGTQKLEQHGSIENVMKDTIRKVTDKLK